MAIDLQQVINSSLGLRIVSLVARAIPPVLGYPLAGFVGGLLARRRASDLIRAVRLNQWVARGEPSDGIALDVAVDAVLRHSARSVFDVYHYLPDIQSVAPLVVLDEVSRQLVTRREFEPRGLLVAGLHLSDFDLILQWMCHSGMRAMVLTIPDPQGARRVEYERRRKTGVNLVPASVSGLRDAVRCLQQGGLVITGMDRPIADPQGRPCFFGRPAALPVHYAYLAMKARVPVCVVAPIRWPDGKYHVISSDPIELDPLPDRASAPLRNAEKVLATAEQFIRAAPEQWSVPLPVWPDLLPLVPD